MRRLRETASHLLMLAAMGLGCRGALPTQLACDETNFCSTGYCCSTSGFCALDGDSTCTAAIDAGATDGGPDGGIADAGEPQDAAIDAGATDAGLDGGFTDGGFNDGGVDAGFPDGGVDAGFTDGGVDAGFTDGGVDAGFTDGGVDAGFTDGGVDAGFTDGGVVDAGADAGHVVVAPSDLTYSANPATFTKGETVTNDVPSSAGGPVASYSISPLPPLGLTFDPASGILSGTATVLAAQGTYVVTATNTGGSTHASLVLTVNDVAPSNLRYGNNPVLFTKGQTVANDTPTNGGGAVVSYAISPSLPTGLSLSTTNGVLSGIPTVISPATSYTVTATNTGGSTAAQLTITVKDLPPSGLTYAVNPVVCTKGQTITADAPSSSGGAVVSWSVSPTLPAGLMLNPATGALSGTPTAIAAETGYTVTASNSGGNAQLTLTITVNDLAPTNLTYTTNPAIFTVNQAIASDAPSVSGGTVTGYQITPALPSGLTLDMISGILSGTPLMASPETTYTVTATNSGGSTQAQLTLTVNDVAPFNLQYATNPAVYAINVPIANDTPSNSGGTVVSYAISTAPPTGLSFNTLTGVLSGTPTVLSAATGYTVTATSSGGSTQVTLTVSVISAPPSGLTYSTNPAVYTNGVTITNNTPSSGGGSVASYSVSPALPAGLSFSTATGVISGAPTVVSAMTSYTVTATNAAGSTQATLSITVNDVPPSGLTYAVNPAVYTKGTAITNNTPAISGGAVVSWSVSPPLPAGLMIDSSTGIISGTPSAASAQTTYTITATNSGGSTMVTLTLAVNDIAPMNLTYATNPLTILTGQAITPDVPSNNGGTITSYTISGTPLPDGLSLNASTGVISGIPSAPAAQASYAIHGMNSVGSTGVQLTITVNAASFSTSGVQGALATGGQRSCAIVNGGVACWGAGPLGDNSTASASTPVAVSGLTNGVTQVAVSSQHACAIENGALFCWGNNANGQLGNNSTAQSLVPVQVTGMTSGVQAVATGSSNTCAVVNGGAYCWGSAASGQVGNGTTSGKVLIPAAASGLSSGVRSIAVGAAHVCALVDGAIYCWGDDSRGQLGGEFSSSAPVKASLLNFGSEAIVAGDYFSCTLLNGGVICWGAGDSGQLGNGSTADQLTNTHVTGLTSGVSAIAAGATTAYAVVNGGVMAWGSNIHGELGNGAFSSSPTDTPVQVQGLTSGAEAVSGGANLGCALVNGGVQCWGTNTNGGLGSDSDFSASNIAMQVTGITGGVEEVSSGIADTCAIVNGGVQCWGQNRYGELGNNTTATSSAPVQVVGITSGAQVVSVGGYEACAIVNGGVQCWGDNLDGQLGNNTTTNSSVPVQVSTLTSGAQAVAVSSAYACAIVNGGAQCWGWNYYGQLGSNAQSSVPVVAASLTTGVQAIATGDDHACAILNGSAACWGTNAAGQLGNNSTTSSTAYVQPSGLSHGVQALALTGSGSCAVVNGSASCWGWGFDGELGDGSTMQSLVPVQVSSLTSGVAGISGASATVCALVNGGVQCWGQGTMDQLGNGSTSYSTTPGPVSNLSGGVQSLSCGGNDGCILSGAGIECWGSNMYGQLGSNSGAMSATPVVVGAWAP